MSKTPIIMPGDLVVIDGRRKTLHSAPLFSPSDCSTSIAKGQFGWGLFAIALSQEDRAGMVCIVDSTGIVGKTFANWLSTPEEVIENWKQLERIYPLEEYDA